MKRLLITLTLLAALSPIKAFSQWLAMTTEEDSLAMQGLKCAYNIEFDKANNYFTQFVNKDPSHPVGHFLMAILDWQRIIIEKNYEKYKGKFFDDINKTIYASDRMLDTNQFFFPALFFKTAAIGYRARYYCDKEDWLKAIDDARDAYKLMTKCFEIAPTNTEMQLGIGLYNYFAVYFPDQYPIIKPFMTFLPGGDKEIGLLQLKSCAIASKYAEVEARVALLQIYYSFEKNSWEAYKLADSLHKDFPNNPLFYKYLGRTLAQLGRQDEYEQIWREILINVINKKYGFDNLAAREALYYIGSALMNKGKIDDAINYFKKCEEACSYIDKKEPSGIRIKSNLKLGELFEMKGKKDIALQFYKKVMNWRDYQGSHSEAANKIVKK